jgi:hypothetical protein
MVVLTSKGYVDLPGVDLEQFGVVQSEHLSRKGKSKKMPDSEAKKKWIRENTTMIHIKLNHNTDKDLLAFFETLDNRAGFIKQLCRDYLKEHQTATEAQPAEEKKPAVDYSWFFEDEDENEQ